MEAINAYQQDCPPLHIMARDYLGYAPAVPAVEDKGAFVPDAERVAEAASMMAERPLDAVQGASLAILRAKGLA